MNNMRARTSFSSAIVSLPRDSIAGTAREGSPLRRREDMRSHITAGVPAPYGEGDGGSIACEAKSSNLSCGVGDRGQVGG